MSETPAQDYMERTEGVMPEGIAAVGVYLTEPAPVRPMPQRSFIAQQLAPVVGGPPVQLTPHPTRTAIHVRALGGTLFIGQESYTATATSGYPLPDGAAVELDTSDALWIGAQAADDKHPAGSTITAGILATFSDGGS